MNIFDKIREVLENAEVKWVTSKPQHILELPQYQQVFGIDINTYRKLFAKEHVRVKISITQIGQIYEVLVDRDGYIIDGLSRAEAMYELYGKYLAKVLPISCTEDIVTCSVLLLVTTLSKGSSDRLAVMLVNAKRFLASLGVDVEKVIDVKIPTLSELVGNVPNKSTLIRDIYDAIEYINAVLELPRIYVDRVKEIYENYIKGRVMLTGHSLTDAAILYALMAQLFCMNFHEMLKLLRRVGVNEEKVKKCVNNILQQFGIKHRDLVELCKTRLKSIVEEYECYKIDVDSVYNYVKKFFTKNSVIFATITKALCPNLSDDDLYFLFLVDTTGKKIAKVVEDVKKMFVKCK